MHLTRIERSRHKDTFPVTWNIGKRCNYDCSYCIPQIHDMISPHLSFDIMRSVIDKLVQKIPDKVIKLSFTGGEPTVNPNFAKLIHYINSTYKDKFILVTTSNGSRTAEYYIGLMDIMRFVFSAHFEFLDPEVFKKKMKKIYDSNKNMSVVVMMEPGYWNNALDIIKFCQENLISFDLKKIRIGEFFVEYTKEQNDFMDSFGIEGTQQDIIGTFSNGEQKGLNSNQLVNDKLTDFRGWKCSIGKEFLYIRNNGEVRRASCGVGESLGSIFTDFDVPSSEVICNRSQSLDEGRCIGVAEVRVTKWK